MAAKPVTYNTKKVQTLKSATVNWSYVTKHPLFNITRASGIFGEQEGERKHALQNSDILNYFLWAILLEKYFEKSRRLNRFQESESIEVKSC